MTKHEILDAYRFRHACKEFDPTRKVSDEDLNFLLEVVQLSPSSFGLQPYELFVLQNQELLNKLHPHLWGAQKQLPTCSHMLMFAVKKDITVNDTYFEHIVCDIQQTPSDLIDLRRNVINNHQINEIKMNESPRYLLDWAGKQAYIALGNLMTSAAMIGIDSCPIEGFVFEPVNQILTEYKVYDPSSYQVMVFCSLGYRAAMPARSKTRKPLTELVKFIK